MSGISAAIADAFEEVASGLEERVEHFSSAYATDDDAVKAQVLSEVIDELRRVGGDLAG
ncbi:hypothetical protein [Streptomyces sp. H27-C3]|uniref:hypothetical protein n=1 Tax=Streptomyces sp. H27-C3 TaxID=3046305 RepID=UPI0024B8CF32|nr:hypothetical protein [Streptomyces sp. H27-C3]MDJ0463166.1 hypothetical protein [Streptomyces sp. H27-C3]